MSTELEANAPIMRSALINVKLSIVMIGLKRSAPSNSRGQYKK